MKHFLLIVLSLSVAACSAFDPDLLVGNWRSESADGSWVEYQFESNSTGEKRTWHAANRRSCRTDLYWRFKGMRVEVREIVDYDEHVELMYDLQLKRAKAESPTLNVEIYSEVFTRVEPGA